MGSVDMRLIAGALLLGLSAGATALDESPILARLAATPEVMVSGLPIHAHLSDRQGHDYVLAWATPSGLNGTGQPWIQIAADVPLEDILLAYPRRRSAGVPAGVLFDDGRRYILLAPGPHAAEQLAEAGFAVRRLRTIPTRWTEPSKPVASALSLRALTPDSQVSEIIQAVTVTNLYRILSQLTGDDLVAPLGRATNIMTRYTKSGAPVSNSMQTALEHNKQ